MTAQIGCSSDSKRFSQLETVPFSHEQLQDSFRPASGQLQDSFRQLQDSFWKASNRSFKTASERLQAARDCFKQFETASDSAQQLRTSQTAVDKCFKQLGISNSSDTHQKIRIAWNNSEYEFQLAIACNSSKQLRKARDCFELAQKYNPTSLRTARDFFTSGTARDCFDNSSGVL